MTGPAGRKFHFGSRPHPLRCHADASKQVAKKIQPDKSWAEISREETAGQDCWACFPTKSKGGSYVWIVLQSEVQKQQNVWYQDGQWAC